MSSSNAAKEEQPFLGYSDAEKSLPLGNSTIKPRKTSSARTSKFLSHTVAIFLTSLFWSVILYKYSTPPRHYGSPKYVYVPSAARYNITTGARYLSCGHSAAEAIDSGCIYSLLLNAWVPSACEAPDFLEEYLDDGSWDAFEDENQTKPLTKEELGFRDTYYTSARDHYNHCAIMWKLQYWALFEEWGAVDSIVASPAHTDHCALFMRDHRDDERATLVEIGFSGCWIRD
ncbi:hypothetical protein HYFRA_00003973 [Hymenoscyphus fraxineus]|uniref:Uncharacterized protein n=1 Tax=Hymenoscyphus fraxineus TaxID=746836 RepID=A0A9N9PK30_9HELO|nr:hypothetical protein HYFRA_00003973 [Hymenoscyphus fraxineus]